MPILKLPINSDSCSVIKGGAGDRKLDNMSVIKHCENLCYCIDPYIKILYLKIYDLLKQT